MGRKEAATFEASVCQVPVSDTPDDLDHLSFSFDAPTCDVLSPGGWVKERQDLPQLCRPRKLHRDSQMWEVKCSPAWALSKMQASLVRATLHIVVTLVGMDLLDLLSGGSRGERWWEGKKLGRMWNLSRRHLPCWSRGPREKDGATLDPEGRSTISCRGADTFLATPDSRPGPGPREAQHPHGDLGLICSLTALLFCARLCCRH